MQDIGALPTSTDVRLSFYKTDKSFLGQYAGTQLTSVANDPGTAAAVYTLGSDGYINKIDVTGITAYYKTSGKGDTGFFRFSSPGIDGDSIITVNEPIEESGEDPVETYTITRNLTNCVSSSSITSVTKGSSHNESLTASSGYTMDGATVTVTMGGTNITSSAVSGGAINIGNVTGNIVITAVAVETQAEVYNWLPLATVAPNDSTIYGGDYNGDGKNDGYLDGSRYSSSAGGIVTAAGWQTTGVIPVSDGDIIRVKNIESIQFYLAVSPDGIFAAMSPSDRYAEGYTQPDSNGVYTFKAFVGTTVTPRVGVRFSGKGISGDTIITINKEIV